jgi:hypothetical protein
LWPYREEAGPFAAHRPSRDWATNGTMAADVKAQGFSQAVLWNAEDQVGF